MFVVIFLLLLLLFFLFRSTFVYFILKIFVYIYGVVTGLDRNNNRISRFLSFFPFYIYIYTFTTVINKDVPFVRVDSTTTLTNNSDSDNSKTTCCCIVSFSS